MASQSCAVKMLKRSIQLWSVPTPYAEYVGRRATWQRTVRTKAAATSEEEENVFYSCPQSFANRARQQRKKENKEQKERE